MKKAPTSRLIAAGDTLIYGNGEEVPVVNLLWVNGRRGLQVKPERPMFVSDRFLDLERIEQLVAAGVFKVKRAKPHPPGEPT